MDTWVIEINRTITILINQISVIFPEKNIKYYLLQRFPTKMGIIRDNVNHSNIDAQLSFKYKP